MYDTFHERLIDELEAELQTVELTIRKARKTESTNPDLMYVIGKLLMMYPVSFHIDFLISALDLQVNKGSYKERCVSLYFRSNHKAA